MGNSQSGFLNRYSCLSSEWRLIPVRQGKCIFENIISRDLCEYIRLRNVDNHKIRIYEDRKIYSYVHIPQIYDFTFSNHYRNQQLLHRSQTFSVEVLVEATDFRLNDYQNKLFGTPNHQDFIISRLRQALLGFRYLFKKLGTFKVTPEQIGWTHTNTTKVWISSNFASNDIDSANASQTTMVRQTFLSFSKVLQFNPFPRELKSFEQAIQICQILKNYNKIEPLNKEIGLECSSNTQLRIFESKVNQQLTRAKSLSRKFQQIIRKKTGENSSEINQMSASYFPYNDRKGNGSYEQTKIEQYTSSELLSKAQLQDSEQKNKTRLQSNPNSSIEACNIQKSRSMAKVYKEGSENSIQQKLSSQINFFYQRSQKNILNKNANSLQNSTNLLSSETYKKASLAQPKNVYGAATNSSLNSNKSARFTVKNMKYIDLPYQTSSSKIPILRQSIKVCKPSKMSESFQSKVRPKDLSQNRHALKGSVKQIQLRNSKREINNQEDGEAYDLGRLKQINVDKDECGKYQLQQDKIKDGRKLNLIEDVMIKRISQVQLENELDDLFQSNELTDQPQDSEELDTMRRQVLQILIG